MTTHKVRSLASRIPSFARRAELAEFSDTHDMSDYRTELEPIEVEVFTPRCRSIALRIDVVAREEVEALAREQGLRPERMRHVRILRRRDAERARRAGGGAPEPMDKRRSPSLPVPAPGVDTARDDR